MKERKAVSSNTLYRKRCGKFVPITEEIHVAGWSKGFYLVEIKPGLTSMARALTPDYAELECAFKALEGTLTKGLIKAMELRPQLNSSKAVIQAFEKFKTEVGEEIPTQLGFDSANDVVRNAFTSFFAAYEDYKRLEVKSDVLEM